MTRVFSFKLSNKNLPVKKNKKRNYKKVQRQQKRAAAGESIDKRPKEIDTREEFGNWGNGQRFR